MKTVSSLLFIATVSVGCNSGLPDAGKNKYLAAFYDLNSGFIGIN